MIMNRVVKAGVIRALVFALSSTGLQCGLAFTLAANVSAANQTKNTAYTELAISGMKSDASASQVQEALAAVPGVLQATVSLEDGRAYLVLDGDAIPPQKVLIQAVAAAGFKARSAVGREYEAYEAFDSQRDDTRASSTERNASAAELHELSKDAHELRDLFNDDVDKVRLVVLLSPS